ncbi:hypothetical protein D3C87_1345200 [compost metagenome]
MWNFANEHGFAFAQTLGPQALVETQGLQSVHGWLPIREYVRYAISTNAMHVIQRHRGVVRAEVQINLAAIVALGKHHGFPVCTQTLPLFR